MRPILYDISPPLDSRLAVFPGDTPLSREPILQLEQGDSVTLSTLRASCHVGAHVDAPSHYDLRGDAVGARPLDAFLGPCRVIRVSVEPGALVTLDSVHLALRLDESADDAFPDLPRVLFATGTYRDPREFNPDFAALCPRMVERMGEAGARLVGIDTPSIDPASSTDLQAHRAVARHDMNILEGVVLDDVPSGVYELIALPLRLTEFDGSPVRAVLRELRR